MTAQPPAPTLGDPLEDRALLQRVLEILDPPQIAKALNEAAPDCWDRARVSRWAKGQTQASLSLIERQRLAAVLPARAARGAPAFRFVDLFAGIGGLRRGFDAIGGECVFTSEWDRFAGRTYRANYWCDPERHRFNEDIRDITLSQRPEIDEASAYRHIDGEIPDHEVLLAGFPCQPFSLAGVSKKNALGRKHGFECNAQGTLFFDVARILAAKRPACFLLENVKNLKSHDGGRTFRVIIEALDELGYAVADAEAPKGRDPKVIDARHFLPQHRERIALVGFRRDLDVHEGFSLASLTAHYPAARPTFGDLLEPEVAEKYILSPKLWRYLFDYARKHREKGNGFGFGLTGEGDTARTLSARYHKDGSEILVDRGFDPAQAIDSPFNADRRPRRLTPRECARLMGFDAPGESRFVIPVSDTQAYRQFGNSVAVPVFEAIARLMAPRIAAALATGAAVSGSRASAAQAR